jgi:hypothetical protein
LIAWTWSGRDAYLLGIGWLKKNRDAGQSTCERSRACLTFVNGDQLCSFDRSIPHELTRTGTSIYRRRLARLNWRWNRRNALNLCFPVTSCLVLCQLATFLINLALLLFLFRLQIREGSLLRFSLLLALHQILLVSLFLVPRFLLGLLQSRSLSRQAVSLDTERIVRQRALGTWNLIRLGHRHLRGRCGHWHWRGPQWSDGLLTT